MTYIFRGLVGAAAAIIPFSAVALDADPKNALCEIAAVSAANSAAEIDTQGLQGGFHLYSLRDLGGYQYKVLVRAGDPNTGYLAGYQVVAAFNDGTKGCDVTGVTAL